MKQFLDKIKNERDLPSGINIGVSIEKDNNTSGRSKLTTKIIFQTGDKGAR